MSTNPADSLDQAATRGGGSRPKPEKSLGDLDTGADIGRTASDLDAAVRGLEDLDLETVDLQSRYEILGPLGRGGMGEVLKAVDRRLRRPVAIKRVRGDLAHHPQALARFLTEARAVAALNHFNIVQVYDYGRSAEGPFLAMEFVDGESLAQRLQRGPLPVEEAVDLTCQLCDALALAHGQGIIHRDIKPANILLTATGVPKLSDFGLARREGADHGQTQTGAVLGTLDFMPPEQRLDATKADARSDLWSLAATLYQMLTGKPPKVIHLALLPAELQPIVTKALDDDPARRFQTAFELRKSLRDVLGRLRTTTTAAAAGQCSKCGTINDRARKFCEHCGTSLRAPCPKCGIPAGTWEQFCGECGADFAQEIERQRQDAAARQQQIEQLRGEHRHAEALPLLESLSKLDHPALGRPRDWALQLEPVLREELTSLEAERTQLLEEARARFQAFEDGEALRLLDRIPKPLRTPEVEALTLQATARREEAQRLATEIRSAVQARQYDGLLLKITRLLEIRPRDKSLLKLRDQLKQREDRSRAKAEQRLEEARLLVDKDRLQEALQRLEAIPENLRTEAGQRLLSSVRDQLQRRSPRESSVARSDRPSSRPANTGRGRWIVAGSALVLLVALLVLGAGLRGLFRRSPESAAAPRAPERQVTTSDSKTASGRTATNSPDPETVPPTTAQSTTTKVDPPVSVPEGTAVVVEVENLNEINDSGPQMHPFVSEDGLTLYWSNWPDPESSIWSASRKDVDSLFRDKLKLFPGHSPVVSAEGTEMIFSAPDGTGFLTSLRKPNGSFEAPTPVSELKFQPADGAGPRSLSRDGLTLYLLKKRLSADIWDIWTTNRPTRGGRWETPTPLKIDAQTPFRFSDPSVTSDDLRLYVTAVEDSTPEIVRIGILSRPDATGPFTGFQLLGLRDANGQLPNCECPRHVTSRGELFVASRKLYRKPGTSTLDEAQETARGFDLWKLKGFVPPPQELRANPGGSLDGTWEFLDGELNGRAMPSVLASGRTLRIFGLSYTLTIGASRIEGTLAIDHSAVPHHLDFTPLRGGDATTAGYPQVGIFKREGDTLTIVVNSNRDAPRPSSFVSTGTGVSLQRYRRVMPPDESGTATTALPSPAEKDFVSLFNGTTLEGWEGNGHVVRDGTITCLGSGGLLRTKKQYSDFVLRCDVRIPIGGNHGLGIRAPLTTDPKSMMEIAILDDHHSKFANVSLMQRTGGIYGFAPSKPGFLKPAGEWNSLEVACAGERVTVTLNGTLVTEASTAEAAKLPMGRDNFLRKRGYIVLMGHTGQVAFRNIRIRDDGIARQSSGFDRPVAPSAPGAKESALKSGGDLGRRVTLVAPYPSSYPGRRAAGTLARLAGEVGFWGENGSTGALRRAWH